jgi:hypothetical protein
VMAVCGSDVLRVRGCVEAVEFRSRTKDSLYSQWMNSVNQWIRMKIFSRVGSQRAHRLGHK